MEVGGLVTLRFSGASGTGQQLGLAFSESSLYIGRNSNQSSGGGSPDDALYATVSGAGTYTMPADKLRGGFRYLTLFLTTSGWVDLTGISLNFTPAPGKANPQDYANFFASNDPLLDKLSYTGAYTVQMNTIGSNQGRVWGPPSSGWQNNTTVGVGTTVLVDGRQLRRPQLRPPPPGVRFAHERAAATCEGRLHRRGPRARGQVLQRQWRHALPG